MPPASLVDQDRHVAETGTLERVADVDLELRLAWTAASRRAGTPGGWFDTVLGALPRRRPPLPRRPSRRPGWSAMYRSETAPTRPRRRRLSAQSSPPRSSTTSSTTSRATTTRQSAPASPNARLAELGWPDGPPPARGRAWCMATASHDVDALDPDDTDTAVLLAADLGGARNRTRPLRRLRQSRAQGVRPRQRRRVAGWAGSRASHPARPTTSVRRSARSRRLGASRSRQHDGRTGLALTAVGAQRRRAPAKRRRTRTRNGIGWAGLAEPTPTSTPATTVITAAVTPVEAIILEV